MYIGKDKDGRYNFIDTGRFIMSKEFIENKSISIDKSFDEDDSPIFSLLIIFFTKKSQPFD